MHSDPPASAVASVVREPSDSAIRVYSVAESSPPAQDYRIRTPEMGLAFTRRWISDVPSKIVQFLLACLLGRAQSAELR